MKIGFLRIIFNHGRANSKSIDNKKEIPNAKKFVEYAINSYF